MSQFKNDLYFKFANKNSKDYNICLISNEDSDTLFGIHKDILEEEGGLGKSPVFYGVNKPNKDISIKIAKINKYGDIDSMTEKEIQEIGRWLFTKDYYQPLEFSNGLILYGMFIEGNSWEIGNYNQGIITLTFRLGSKCAYSKVYKYPISVEGKKKIKIANFSNAEEFIYTDIFFELKDNTSDISITNITTSETISFKGLEQGESIYIYSDTQQMKSMVDDNRNVYLKSNRKSCIKLAYGQNDFEIIANGRVFLNIIYQNEIALY